MIKGCKFYVFYFFSDEFCSFFNVSIFGCGIKVIYMVNYYRILIGVIFVWRDEDF